MRKFSVILGVFIIIAILANISNIAAHVKLYSFENNKKVTTETKVVTFNEMYDILHQQRELAKELEGSKEYSLIGDEVRKGLDEASQHEGFLHDNNEVKSIKLRLPITKYKDDEKIIEFISGKGEVLEVFENG